MKPLYSRLMAIGVAAVLAHGTAGRVEGSDVKLEDLQSQLTSMQSQFTSMQAQLNSVQAQLNSVQFQLSHIPPTWDRTKLANGRFAFALGGDAILDEETGLVWEQSPSTTPLDWSLAQRCGGKTVGLRKGWRLPTVQELGSLIDPTQSNPALPVGHPFANVQSANYWTATVLSDNNDDAYNVDFGSGDVFISLDKSHEHFVWCVRGGQVGADAQ